MEIRGVTVTGLWLLHDLSLGKQNNGVVRFFYPFFLDRDKPFGAPNEK